MLYIFLACVCGAHGDPPLETYPRADLLIEATELAKPEVMASHRLLDVRPKEKYEAGHIPGAVSIDPAAWGKAFGDGKDVDGWSKRLGAAGVTIDQPVVVYGEGAMPEVARVWWILRYWGVKKVRILNGGWRAWHEVGGEATKKVTPPAPVAPMLVPATARLATKDDLLKELKNHPSQIIDARSDAEFCGEQQTAKRSGAIPGAAHLEWSDLLDKKTQRFRTAAEIAKLFAERHIDVNKPTVTYCQSGGRASVMAFGLELMGAKSVRNYYKSWAEWGNSDDTPIVKPKK
jgi:thiosulfate/3-mercaptopyruvate sulfurtransferase